MARKPTITALAREAGLGVATIDWHTVDGGGGHSESATFSLDGSIGQPDAQPLSLCSADGGPGCVDPTWELTGGFWAAWPAAAQEPSASCNGDSNCIFRDGFES